MSTLQVSTATWSFSFSSLTKEVGKSTNCAIGPGVSQFHYYIQDPKPKVTVAHGPLPGQVLASLLHRRHKNCFQLASYTQLSVIGLRHNWGYVAVWCCRTIIKLLGAKSGFT